MAIPISRVVIDHLANAAGDTNIAVDGSGTAVEFYYEVPDGYSMDFFGWSAVIMDAGIKNDDLGGISALSTGLTFAIKDKDGTELLDFTAGENIKSNFDFMVMGCGGENPELTAGDDIFTPTFCLNMMYGQPWRLNEGDKIYIKVEEDISDITKFEISIRGMLV